jgi:hypothetical protein
MPTSQLLIPMMKRSLDMLEKHLSDFSETDMLVRPVPHANHAAWQLTHMANSANNMLKAFNPDANIPLPPRFDPAFKKESATSDDPNLFPTKAELLTLLHSILDAQVAVIEKMSDEQLAQPSPEKLRSFAPTLAALAMMNPLHATMHIGQIQVIRRKLGRPVMF